jgi:hypothetical protein
MFVTRMRSSQFIQSQLHMQLLSAYASLALCPMPCYNYKFQVEAARLLVAIPLASTRSGSCSSDSGCLSVAHMTVKGGTEFKGRNSDNRQSV